MNDKPVDLAHVRHALAQLDRVAEEHPELVDLGADPRVVQEQWRDLLIRMEETDVVKKLRTFRLTDELIARLDSAVQHLEQEIPGPTWNRTAALQFLLTEAMNARGVAPPARRKKQR